VSDVRIALVIPAYNAQGFLPGLFVNLRRQSVAFDQVVVCDDASTDATAEIARQFGAEVVRQESNGGCSAAKNRALEAVRCPWVHFHDADDLFAEGFVARARERIAASGESFDALLFDVEQRDAVTGAVIARSRLPQELELDPARYVIAHTVNNCGVYRTDFVRDLNGFDADPAVLYNEDRAFHLRLALGGARFAVESRIGTLTRWTPKSMSQANRVACLNAFGAVTAKAVAARPGAYPMEAAQAYWQAATGLATHGAMADAERWVRHAVELGHAAPPQASALFRLLCRIGPTFALHARERLIRLFKPWLRRAPVTPAAP
jgi:glycosyltransferase involved in cell wall biosynthesis